MSNVPTSPPPSTGERDLSRTYILVLIVEAVVLTALYAMGRYFS